MKLRIHLMVKTCARIRMNEQTNKQNMIKIKCQSGKTYFIQLIINQ